MEQQEVQQHCQLSKMEKNEEIKAEEKKKTEDKPEEKSETKEKKKEKKQQEIIKKDKAVVRGKDLGVSTKQCVAICNFIRKKKIEQAIKELQEVIGKRKAVPMKGEIPHRKGRGIMSGRYPIKACGIFIKLLKSLNANSIMGGMENVYVSIARADIASRPYKRFGQMRFKKTHVYLEAREVKSKEGKK